MFEILIPYLIGSLLFNIILFLIAFKLQSDKLTDASYALTFIAIAIAAFAFSDKTAYGMIIVGMVLLWALRIGSFLLYRVIRTGKDGRFDEMRSHFLKFGQFWVLQGLSVGILMIPVVLALHGGNSDIGLWALAGVIIWAIGLAVETVADLQKMRFTSTPKNKGHWIDTGIWKYSRHPNYFGEILIWVGLYVYVIQALSGFELLVAAISPVFISVLLIFVSGVPLLEKSADARWGKDPAYRAYKKRTSVLVLAPTKK